jgi:methylmalonyl-CoA mutase C-terminal domain/subunit
MTDTRSQPPHRVLVAKPGLDGHDVGAKIVARALRDAGMEVIYTGLRRSPEEIAEAALEEDVQVVGLSILSGAHLPLCRKVIAELEAREIRDDVLLLLGGTIPLRDHAALWEIGVDGIFPTAAPFGDIVEFIRSHAKTPGAP